MGDQILEFLVIGRVAGDRLNLIGWHITADRLTLFTALQIVIGAVGSLADDTKLAWFHALDLGDLFKQVGGMDVFHALNYIHMYIVRSKENMENQFPLEFCLTPCTTEATRNLLFSPDGVSAVRTHLNAQEVFKDPGRYQAVIDGIAAARAVVLSTNVAQLGNVVAAKLDALSAYPSPYRDDLSELQVRIGKATEQLQSAARTENYPARRPDQ